MNRPLIFRLPRAGAMVALSAALSACAVGPDFHKPAIDVPDSFKEGATWQHGTGNVQGALSSQWWLAFQDDQLTQLIGQSLAANQTIVAAEAAYRLAQAQVASSNANLFPVVGADLSASRSRSGSQNGTNISTANGNSNGSVNVNPTVRRVVAATVNVSWEPDLWGQIRREIESSKETARASDAQLAGQRLSIAAAVASNYFALRALDNDIYSFEQQRDVDERILQMTQIGLRQGYASNDDVLVAQDTLEFAISNLQNSKISREQFEHALAVLIGQAPSKLTIEPRPGYVFSTPSIPLTVPSVLLERRPDVIAAERTAAAANARIGVAKAAFFPTLDLSAQGGYQHSALANLFSLPNRIWTIGPDLAATIFDGGARTAAVQQAQAAYDQQAANYRETVLTAFQSVEDSLSAVNHLQVQASALQSIYQRNQQLFASQQAQVKAGTVSQQNLLTQRLTLLLAQQSVQDTKGQLAQNQVALIKNLGGGWQWDESTESAAKPL